MKPTMLFYKNITALSREVHKKLKFDFNNDFSFAANTHWTPLAGPEIYKAAVSYPILFMGDKTADGKMVYTLAALLGLSDDKNDYVNADKTWQNNVYIPAFIRRYPFVLAGNPGQEELSVCIDKDSNFFNDLKGIDVFNSDGTTSPFLEERIAFLNNFKSSMEQTNQFIDVLIKKNLLKKESIDIHDAKGHKARLHDFWIIDEEKLKKLTGDQLLRLNKSGHLGWIFAQLMSMNNLPRLLELHESKR